MVVARRRTRSVAMVSLGDWNAMKAAMHLVSGPANPNALRESIAQAEAALREEDALIEP